MDELLKKDVGPDYRIYSMGVSCEHMEQLKMFLVYIFKEQSIWFLYMLLYH
jgi:hypothetical protein